MEELFGLPTRSLGVQKRSPCERRQAKGNRKLQSLFSIVSGETYVVFGWRNTIALLTACLRAFVSQCAHVFYDKPFTVQNNKVKN